jgi:hypothetical protein
MKMACASVPRAGDPLAQIERLVGVADVPAREHQLAMHLSVERVGGQHSDGLLVIGDRLVDQTDA